MPAPGRLRIAAVLAALSVVLSVAGALSISTVDGDLLRAQLFAVAAQASAAVAIALLLRDLRSDARRMPWLFAATALTAVVALQVFGAGYAASWDAADAGVPSPPITRLALPALALAFAGLGTAITAVLFAFPRAPAGAVPPWRPVVLGFLLAIPGLMVLFNPMYSVAVPIGLSAVLLVRMSRTAPRPAAADPVERGASPVAARLVRPLAAVALAIVAGVWAVGLWVGIAATGTELATTAMGVSAAAAQLAAVPLFLAVAAILRSIGRASIATSPVALSLTACGMLAGSAIALLAPATDGSSFSAGAAVSGGSLGLWLAVVCAAILPSGFERVAIGAGAVVGGVAAWFLLVLLTGGFGVAVLAAVVLGVGPRPFHPAQPSARCSFSVSSVVSK